jgi:hypothetical protein
VALWQAAREAVTVGIAEGMGVIVVVFWAVRCLSGCDLYPGGVEQVAKGHEYCDAVSAPMWVVAQGGGHQNGVNIGQPQSSISNWRPH